MELIGSEGVRQKGQKEKGKGKGRPESINAVWGLFPSIFFSFPFFNILFCSCRSRSIASISSPSSIHPHPPLPVVQICYISETRGHIYKCMYVCAGALSVREEANVSTFFSFLLPFIEPPSGTPRKSPQRTAMHRTHAHHGS